MEIRAEFERVRKIDADKAAIGFTTGLAGLDKEVLGYHKGEMVLIAGETSSGKSSLMRQGIQANIQAKIPTLVFTYEVYGRSFVTNLLAPFGNIAGSKLRDFRQMDDTRTLTGKKSEVETFDLHLRGVKNWPLWIEDNARKNHIDDICSTARAMIRRHGIESIWLDQVSLARGTGQNETERVEYISKCLVSLARSENVQVGALSQFNRDKDRQSLKRPPRKGDVKQASRLEEDAATEIFLWEDERGDMWIIIAKQRNGALGKIPVTFDKAILWFEDGHK
jgi:replicative DNA helicase